MAVVALNIGAATVIASGALGTAEAVVASVSADLQGQEKVRIRGHILITGNASASTATFRIRQGGVAGAQIYSSGAITVAAAAVMSIPFEIEDDANFLAAGGTYSLTAIGSLAGTINGGTIYLEGLP